MINVYSKSAWQGGAVNILGQDTLRPWGDGFAGTEMIGGTNSLTNVADARTEQFSQVIAYPFNVYGIYNPNTCTQVRCQRFSLGSCTTAYAEELTYLEYIIQSRCVVIYCVLTTVWHHRFP